MLHLPDDEAARGFSISPDGRQIVFEWVSEPWDPTSSLWIVNHDGSGLHKLADDAGRPAWGRLPTHPASTATPTATATRTSTATATRPPGPTATRTPTPTATQILSPTATRTAGASRIYLPLVLKGAPPANDGINGRVTYKGAAAPGIELQLRFYDGSQATTAATTTTDSAGRYRFMGAASLGSEQEYWVRFLSPDNPAYVSIWQTASITAYASGSTMAGGDFDIADVTLLSPPHGAASALPVTFTWQPRGFPGDTYRFVFWDLDADDYWLTEDLGNVGSFTATGLWTDAVFGKEYGWFILVLNGPDSYGESYYYRTITFLAGGASSPAASEEWQHGEGLRKPGLRGARQ